MSALPARELMDRVYRRQRHVYDLTRKPYLLGRDHLITRLDPPHGAHVLELGCGTGRNLIAAARRYPHVQLYGVDISEAMLATARRSVARSGLGGRIVLAQGDATRFHPAALGPQRFERVFFSYSLSMIPSWREALAHGASLVTPGGRLSLVDFGQQDDLPRWFRRLLLAWLGRFRVSPPAGLADEVGKIAAGGGAHASFERLYRGYACYADVGRFSGQPVLASDEGPTDDRCSGGGRRVAAAGPRGALRQRRGRLPSRWFAKRFAAMAGWTSSDQGDRGALHARPSPRHCRRRMLGKDA